MKKASGAKGLAEGLDDGRIRRFIDHAWSKEKLSGAEGHCMMNLCMAATYDPDPRAPNGFRVPFNLESGEVIPNRWAKWRANDPINLVKLIKFGAVAPTTPANSEPHTMPPFAHDLSAEEIAAVVNLLRSQTNTGALPVGASQVSDIGGME